MVEVDHRWTDDVTSLKDMPACLRSILTGDDILTSLAMFKFWCILTSERKVMRVVLIVCVGVAQV